MSVELRSGIFGSGNISDYMNSLERLSALRVGELYPGHGWLSGDPEEEHTPRPGVCSRSL